MENKIRVTVWNEYVHEVEEPEVAAIFPNGIHGCIRDFLTEAGYDVKTATLNMPEHGLTDEVLASTDVLIWWGHMRHHIVSDEVVDKVYERVVNGGMGLICLHSAHKSKIFRRVVGTTGNLSWGDDQKEIMWNVLPSHPICEGVPEHFEIEKEEMYGEPFMILSPTSFSSCPGLSTATSSVPAAHSTADSARCSISSPATSTAEAIIIIM